MKIITLSLFKYLLYFIISSCLFFFFFLEHLVLVCKSEKNEGR